MPTRKDMFEAIKAYYGNALLDEHINLVLDLYEKRPEYSEQLCKEEKKKHKKVPDPKIRLTMEERDEIQKKFDEELPSILASNKATIEPSNDHIDYKEPSQAELKTFQSLRLEKTNDWKAYVDEQTFDVKNNVSM